jgi:hypothetical protein
MGRRIQRQRSGNGRLEHQQKVDITPTGSFTPRKAFTPSSLRMTFSSEVAKKAKDENTYAD